MRDVIFKAVEGEDGGRKGEDGWDVYVDGEKIVERLMDTDMANMDLDPVFKALRCTVKFDFD